MTTDVNVSRVSTGVEEPEWFAVLRLRAYDIAQQLKLPKPDKTKIDSWYLTGDKGLDVAGEQIASFEEIPADLLALIDTDVAEHNLLIQRNHTAAFSSLTAEAAAAGVIFTDILTAIREYPDLVQKYFMRSVDHRDGLQMDTHKLAALNVALLNGGAFLYVPRNVVVMDPVQAVFAVEGTDVDLYNHVLIVAEAGSQVTYVENYFSTQATNEATGNLVAEVYVGENAGVTFGAVDTLGRERTTYVRRTAYVERDGHMEWALGQMNDGDTISENVTLLVGDGSYADAKTVVVGRGNQKENFTTKITHIGKRSEGYILKHGVMKDEASSIFNGIGFIEHGATKANAQQTSRVLMLSHGARGDANPMLLIDEDDVFAGHAASVGRVDETQLYYLMSRGISRREAERLIIHGFLAPVVNQLPIEQVRKLLVDVIEKKVRG